MYLMYSRWMEGRFCSPAFFCTSYMPCLPGCIHTCHPVLLPSCVYLPVLETTPPTLHYQILCLMCRELLGSVSTTAWEKKEGRRVYYATPHPDLFCSVFPLNWSKKTTHRFYYTPTITYPALQWRKGVPAIYAMLCLLLS